MTNIASVPGIDNAKLNKLARSLLVNLNDPENVQLVKAVTVLVDGDPQPITVSFDELEGLINIIDTSRPIHVRIDPSQWVIMTYKLEDMTELQEKGYRVVDYVLDLDSVNRILKFNGTMYHTSTIETHPDYDPSVEISALAFDFVMLDFDMIQQIAITRTMASCDKNFEKVAGTFDVCWIYNASPNGIHFTTKDEE